MSLYKSNLFVRDACSDAFGSDATDAICNPSTTLCCVRIGQDFPACQQYLGKGWCCVGSADTDNCYVDQVSVCNQTDSVACPQLAAGTTQACCPSLTTCASNFNASLSEVRCNIQYGDLQQLALKTTSSIASSTTAPASSSKTTTTSLLSSSSLSTSSTSTQVSSALATASGGASPSNTISSGALAGAIIGSILAFILAIILVYIAARRYLRRRKGNPGETSNPMPVPAQNKLETFSNDHNSRFNGSAAYEKSELPAIQPASELSVSPARHRGSTFELSST